jgi:hypothetical protein
VRGIATARNGAKPVEGSDDRGERRLDGHGSGTSD